jgi:monoamine oxidase
LSLSSKVNHQRFSKCFQQMIFSENQSRRSFLQKAGTTSLFCLSNGFWTDAFESSKTDAIVLGAGLSGLYTAMMLQEKGYTVKVIEAQNRIGGRLYTLDDLPGRPNTGGTEVGDNYQRLLKLANQTGIKIEDPAAERPSGGLLSINGKLIKESDWATSSDNLLAENEKKIIPALLESSFLKDRNPMQTLDDWYNPKFAEFDIPFSEFLKKNGASAEAIRLINANSNTNDIARTSTLNYLKSQTFRYKSGNKKTLRIAGGSQRLPEAMAKTLKNEVLMGKVVNKIEQTKAGVRVTCTDGSKHEAKICICSLPFKALQNVKFNTKLPSILQEAISQMQYTAITQVHIGAKGNFWEDDKLPINLWTDSAIGRFFANKHADGSVTYLCWINGIEAQAIDKFSEKEIGELALKELARLRPSTVGKLEVLKVNSWGRNPYAGGAYYHLGIGQASRWWPEITKPHGNIYFVGEHTALQGNGMESALESAERMMSQLK